MSVKKAIAKIIDGLEMLSENLEGESTSREGKDTVSPKPAPDMKADGADEEEAQEEVAEEEAVNQEYPTAHYKEEEFVITPENVKENFSYRQLKSFCAELDLGGTGKTEELQAKLLDFINADIPEEITEELEYFEEEEESQLEKELETPEPIEAEEEELEEEDETLYDRVENFVKEEGLEAEDLADLLADSGYSPKGKMQALIAKVVEAIENGDIAFEEEGETEEAEEEELAIVDYLEDYMEIEPTDARAEAMQERLEDLDEQIAEGEIETEGIKAFLLDYFDFDEEIYAEIDEVLDENQIETVYKEIAKALVDDDGEVHDLEEAYLLDERYACCGKYLNELESGNLHCDVCSTEWEVE